MHVSKSNPELLISDNHTSHLGLEITTLAEKHGLAILTFPPHCSHRLQSLDVTVFGPFKTFYNRLADAWITPNPGRSISIYEIAKLSGAALLKAFNFEDITSALKATGIFPLNPLVFTEDDFLPSYVTNSPSCSTEHAAFQNTTSTDEEIVLKLHPHSRVSATTSRRPSKQQKSVIITSKSEKLKRFPELVLRSSEDDEVNNDLLLDSTSDEEDPLSITSEKDVAEIEHFVPTTVSIMIFAVSKVYSNANKYRNFVDQSIRRPDADNDYEVKFLKRLPKIKNGFLFPETEDLASVNHNDLVCILEPPSPVATTSRLSHVFKFSKDLVQFNIC